MCPFLIGKVITGASQEDNQVYDEEIVQCPFLIGKVITKQIAFQQYIDAKNSASIVSIPNR